VEYDSTLENNTTLTKVMLALPAEVCVFAQGETLALHNPVSAAHVSSPANLHAISTALALHRHATA